MSDTKPAISTDPGNYWFNMVTAYPSMKPFALAAMEKQFGKDSDEYKAFAAIPDKK